jgi:hypothetical protein
MKLGTLLNRELSISKIDKVGILFWFLSALFQCKIQNETLRKTVLNVN